MARVVRYQNAISPPAISHKQLLTHLTTVNREAINLKSISNGHAIFTSLMHYPLTNKTNAQYTVIARLPLTDEIFYSTNITYYIYPSKAAQSVQFIFNTYTEIRCMREHKSWVD